MSSLGKYILFYIPNVSKVVDYMQGIENGKRRRSEAYKTSSRGETKLGNWALNQKRVWGQNLEINNIFKVRVEMKELPVLQGFALSAMK